jgi:3-dehydroquinate synthetase
VVWKPDALVERMRQDKKVRQGKVKFVLARGIGDAFVAEDVDLAQVRALLDDTLV